MLDIKPFKKGETDPADWLEKFYRWLDGNYWLDLLLAGRLVPKGEKATFNGNVNIAGTFVAHSITQLASGATRYSYMTDGNLVLAKDVSGATVSQMIFEYDATRLGSAIRMYSDYGDSSKYIRIAAYNDTGTGKAVLSDSAGNSVTNTPALIASYGDAPLSFGANGLRAFYINTDSTVSFQSRASAPAGTSRKLWSQTDDNLYWNGNMIENAVRKNAASGYAGLDASSKLTGSQQVYGTAANTACVGNDSRLSLSLTPEAITSTSEGVAASVTVANTEVTTNGDSDEDNVTLGAGTVGQLKHIYCKAVGNAADSFKVTPATMIGGTKVSFASSPLGKGCTFIYTASGWICIGAQGGVVT